MFLLKIFHFKFLRENGVKVPCGKVIEAEKTEKCSLNYNEYIVYDTSQIKMRYLVKIEFLFQWLLRVFMLGLNVIYYIFDNVAIL